MQRDKYGFKSNTATARALFINALATGGYRPERGRLSGGCGNSMHPLGVACEVFLKAELGFGWWQTGTFGDGFVEQQTGDVWMTSAPIMVAEWLGMSCEAVRVEWWDLWTRGSDYRYLAQQLAEGKINPFKLIDGEAEESCVGVWLVVAMDEEWPPSNLLAKPSEYKSAELIDADATGIRGAMHYASIWNDAMVRRGEYFGDKSARMWAIVQPGIVCPDVEPRGLLKARGVKVGSR